MMSDRSSFEPTRLVAEGMGKGCLAGIALAVLFFALSGVLFLLLGITGLQQNIRLLLTFAGGPILGTIGVVVVLLIRARQTMKGVIRATQTQAGWEDDPGDNA